MQEIDYLMQLDESGVIVHEDDAAVLNNVVEWFKTPRGSVYGNPAWGNILHSFQHEPPTEATEIAIENMIVVDLPRDVRNVQISGIRCAADPGELDVYNIALQTGQGLLTQQITLGGAA